jgi:hypothetical protein
MVEHCKHLRIYSYLLLVLSIARYVFFKVIDIIEACYRNLPEHQVAQETSPALYNALYKISLQPFHYKASFKHLAATSVFM